MEYGMRKVNSITKADILLIYPPYSSWVIEAFNEKGTRGIEFFKARTPPFGIMYLASYIRSKGYTVNLIDLSVTKLKKSQFIKILDDIKPKIIGLSVVSENYDSAIQFCKTIKEWNKDVITILGGPHVTFMDKETCQSEFADVVVRGEGEFTFYELVEYYLGDNLNGSIRGLGDIKGITFGLSNGEIIRTAKRPFINDLDILPFPARDLINENDYLIRGGLITSRGCPGACIFCAASALAGGKYRVRSIDNVIDEIEQLINIYGYDTLYIMDDTFTAIPNRVVEFCEKKKKRNLSFKWYCESRADAGSYELFKMMAENGCNKIQFGAESGSQEVLDAIRKKITIEQIENSVRWAHEAGIQNIMCSFIIGHHTDTHESIKMTIEFAERLVLKYDIFPIFSVNTPLPGTFIYNNREKLGIKLKRKNLYSNLMTAANISTNFLGSDDLQRYYLLAYERTGKISQNMENKILARTTENEG
jgi:radical SAM superfamily enzyme YgiQ (UPF0313 family)